MRSERLEEDDDDRIHELKNDYTHAFGDVRTSRPLTKPFAHSFNWMSRNRNLVGLGICVALFLSGFLLQGNFGVFFNISGLIVVVGGTAGATLVSYRLEQLIIVYKVLLGSYRQPVKQISEIVEILVDLSVKCRLKGLLALQEDEKETTILFLHRALGFLVDGYPLHQIRELLYTEMMYFRLRREKSERVLLTMAEISPSFGLVGSVVGMIAMLVGVGDTEIVLSTVPIALTSTIYGIVFANFFFLPFAVNIRERTEHELLLQKVITDGILAIGSEQHPRVLEMKLKSFLTPSARSGRLVSLERIREKFRLQPETVRDIQEKT
ncbi:MAG: motility protein A [Thermodesulfobacteriota bacterium]